MRQELFNGHGEDHVVKIPQRIAIVGPTFDADQPGSPRSHPFVRPLPHDRTVKTRADAEVEHARRTLVQHMPSDMRRCIERTNRHAVPFQRLCSRPMWMGGVTVTGLLGPQLPQQVFVGLSHLRSMPRAIGELEGRLSDRATMIRITIQ